MSAKGGDQSSAAAGSATESQTPLFKKEKEEPLFALDRREYPFGVIPELENLGVTDAYRKMLVAAKGDKNRIRAFMGMIQMTQAHPLYYSFNGMKSDEEKIKYCGDLAAFSMELKAEGFIKTDYTAEAFLSDETLREKFASSFVILKYIEGFGARYWQTWAKEMRGNTLFVNPETDEVKLLGFKLPRGAEVLTNMHSKSDDSDTQDVKGGKVDILDVEQQDTCKRLVGLQKIDGHLSSKGDGSLLVITVYTGAALKIMRATMKVFANDFVKTWMEMSLKLSNGTALVIPSTQGTLWEGGFMAEYMVTSILAGGGADPMKGSREILEQMEKDGLTYLDAWNQLGEPFIAKILEMKRFDDLSDTHTFCFEAICKFRKAVWEARRHVELAVEYDRDRLILLGVSVCEKRFYIPHSAYGSKFSIPFEEPLWWDINDSTVIQSMMEAIDQLVLNQNGMDKRKFLETFRPNNKNFDPHNEKHLAEAILDYEGWVFMKKAALIGPEAQDTDFCTASSVTGFPLMIYSKIKTEPYYLTHKFKSNKIPHLVELSKTAGHIFPITRMVADFFKDGALVERLISTRSDVAAYFTFEEDSQMVVESRAAFAKQLSRAKEQAASGAKVKIPKDPFDGFEKRPLGVRWKMLINLHKNAYPDAFGKILIGIFAKCFPTLDVEINDLGAGLVNLVMLLEYWDAEIFAEKVKKLQPDSVPVQLLTQACIGHAVL